MILEKVSAESEDIAVIKRDMQDAFQVGAEKYFGKNEKKILPDKDIDKSLFAKGAAIYKAVENGEIIGGVVVCIDEKTQCNHLDLLYVKNGVQSKGVGQAIWKEIEKLYPDTKVWETFTPYFEKRNVHFYINVCGFHAVEFFNPKHKSTDIPDDMVGGDYFFRFEKIMK